MSLRDIESAVAAFGKLSEEEKAVFNKEVGRRKRRVSPLKGRKLGPRAKRKEAAEVARESTKPKAKAKKAKAKKAKLEPRQVVDPLAQAVEEE